MLGTDEKVWLTLGPCVVCCIHIHDNAMHVAQYNVQYVKFLVSGRDLAC